MRLIVLAVVMALATSCGATGESAKLDRAVVLSSDLPGWRQGRPASAATPASISANEGVSHCMGRTGPAVESWNGAYFDHGAPRSEEAQEINSVSQRRDDVSTVREIVQSPRWGLCLAESSDEQSVVPVVEHARADPARLDLDHRKASVRIRYALRVGTAVWTYFLDVVVLWANHAQSTIHFFAIGHPPSEALEARVTKLVTARLGG